MEEQLKERLAQQQTEKNMKEIQEKLDEMRVSHKKLLTHLEAQSASPQSSDLQQMKAHNNTIDRVHDPEPQKIIIQPIYDPMYSDLAKLKEEMRQHTQKFQEQIASVEDCLKKPIKSSQILWEDKKELKDSDSQGSLKSETQLIPIHSSNLANKPKKIIESPVYYEERIILPQKIVSNSTRAAGLKNYRNHHPSYIKKARYPFQTNVTSGLKNHVHVFSSPMRVTEEEDEYYEEGVVERVLVDPGVFRIREGRGAIRYLSEDFEEEEPIHLEYRIRKPMRAVNRSYDEGYHLMPANDTNTKKLYTPEKKVRAATPKRLGLQKRNRGIKRRQRFGEIERPNNVRKV